MTDQIKPTPKRKGGFYLPAYSQKRNKAEMNGRMSHVLLSMASDDRVLAETPSLRRLYEFLARKP